MGYATLVVTYIAVAGALVWILRRLARIPPDVPGPTPPHSTAQPA